MESTKKFLVHVVMAQGSCGPENRDPEKRRLWTNIFTRKDKYIFYLK